MKEKPLSRRRFMKWAAGVGAAAAGGILLSNFGHRSNIFAAGAREASGSRKWVMVIDSERCNGCKACTDACIEEHNVPPAGGNPSHNGKQEWIRVVQTSDDPSNAAPYLPLPCLNCQNAPCTKVCPVGATYYNDDGLVVTDNTRCIGCRFWAKSCSKSTGSGNTSSSYGQQPEYPLRVILAGPLKR